MRRITLFAPSTDPCIKIFRRRGVVWYTPMHERVASPLGRSPTSPRLGTPAMRLVPAPDRRGHGRQRGWGQPMDETCPRARPSGPTAPRGAPAGLCPEAESRRRALGPPAGGRAPPSVLLRSATSPPRTPRRRQTGPSKTAGDCRVFSRRQTLDLYARVSKIGGASVFR
jgi:hypothetical protein